MPTFGFGPEVVTSTTRPATPAIGQLIYQTDTDEYLKYVTDSDGTVRWMQIDHGSNRSLVINGGFDVWQRGTSFSTIGSPYYGPDRWQTVRGGFAAGGTYSRVASDLANFNYFLRCQRDNLNTSTAQLYAGTSFETIHVKRLQGKYVTLSFWARAGASFLSTGSTLLASVLGGTGTDGNFLVTGFSGGTTQASGTVALTSGWKRFSITTSAVVPTSVTQLEVLFMSTPVGTAGTTDYYDITGVQLEVGTAPSDFEYREFGDELRRCQRYFEMSYPIGTVPGAGSQLGSGCAANTSALAASTAGNVAGYSNIPFKVEKRSTPTIVPYDYDGTANAARVQPLNVKRTGLTSFANVSPTGWFQFLSFDATSAVTIASASNLVFSWTANAEL